MTTTGGRSWRFLTNHAHVLLTVSSAPDLLVDQIAERVGITSRQALTILRDLEESGYLTRTRVGRRTHYSLETSKPFRHPALAQHDIKELLAIFESAT